MTDTYCIKHVYSECRLLVLGIVETRLSSGIGKSNYKCISALALDGRPFICDGDYIANDWVKE